VRLLFLSNLLIAECDKTYNPKRSQITLHQILQTNEFFVLCLNHGLEGKFLVNLYIPHG
jgi:hypothetical protein